MTGNVLMNQGVVLAIEPGTVVNLNTYYIMVNGTIIMRGDSTNQVIIQGGTSYRGSIIFTSSSAGWNEQAGSGCIIENANLSLVDIQINGASPKIQNSFLTFGVSINGGAPLISKNSIQTLGMFAVINVVSGSPIIVGNEISTQRFNDLGNPDTSYGIYMENATQAYISDNEIVHLGRSSIYAGMSSAVITRNQLWNGVEGGKHLVIQNNTISEGITNPASSSTIVYNNILSGGIHLTGSSDINASYNWWGTTDASEIDGEIWDFVDDFNLGKVNYTPFLTAPNPQAMPDSSIPVYPSPTAAQSANPSSSPSPSVPEFQSVPFLIILIMLSSITVLVYAKTRRRNGFRVC